jgi:hypothetical protein
LAKIEELQAKGPVYLGPLEKCQECQGRKLEVINLEESSMSKELKVEKGFCPHHPEEDTVILGPGRRPVGGKIPGKCKSCVQGLPPAQKPETGGEDEFPARDSVCPPTEVPVEPPPETSPSPSPPDNGNVPKCKTCQEEPSIIDSLGRDMGICRKCLARRAKKNLDLGHKTSFAPFYIPLNDPRFDEIKKWLEAGAVELEQDLPAAVMYRLKLAWREETGQK